MKALRFHSFGSPDVLAVEDVPQPVPGDGEVLIRIEAAGINPSDVANVGGRFPATTLPRVPGRDFAGVLAPGGALVWGSVPGFGITRDGSHAEYAVVPKEAIAIAPSNLTAERAAAVGVPFTTAWGALILTAQLRAGETVLITGAAGAVGQAATQIANWKGARVIGATRAGDAAPGAAAVVDTAADMPARVLELTEGKGADVVFDTVGGALFEASLKCLRRRGRQVAISSSKEPRVSFSLVDFYHNLSRLIGFDSYSYTARDTAEILNELRAGFETGSLIAPRVRTVAVEEAIASYREIAGGSADTKLVLLPS